MSATTTPPPATDNVLPPKKSRSFGNVDIWERPETGEGQAAAEKVQQQQTRLQKQSSVVGAGLGLLTLSPAHFQQFRGAASSSFERMPPRAGQQGAGLVTPSAGRVDNLLGANAKQQIATNASVFGAQQQPPPSSLPPLTPSSGGGGGGESFAQKLPPPKRRLQPLSLLVNQRAVAEVLNSRVAPLDQKNHSSEQGANANNNNGHERIMTAAGAGVPSSPAQRRPSSAFSAGACDWRRHTELTLGTLKPLPAIAQPEAERHNRRKWRRRMSRSADGGAKTNIVGGGSGALTIGEKRWPFWAKTGLVAIVIAIPIVFFLSLLFTGNFGGGSRGASINASFGTTVSVAGSGFVHVPTPSSGGGGNGNNNSSVNIVISPIN